jgi:glycosyltransferase EpsD
MVRKIPKKILYCASTASHILNFHLPYLRFFHEMGWQIDVAVGNNADIPYADNMILLPLRKSLLTSNNLRAVYSLRRLLAVKQYDIISAHTTLAGAVVRLAVQLSGRCHAKMAYTSHGYFFSDEPMLSKLPYLWVEKLLAPVTDVLMVMNRTDYELANRYRLGKNIVLIPGMGLDTAKFTKIDPIDKKKLKVSAGYHPDDFIILYAAEMSPRKNQGELIRAFAAAAARESTIKLLLAGAGKLENEYRELARQSGYGERIFFLGYVTDMDSLYRICDLAVSTSRSEGLPFNVMEAMAIGLPVVASRIKGHMDLLGSLNEDCLYNLGDEQVLAKKILTFKRDESLRERVRQVNLVNVEKYDLDVVKSVVIKAYSLVV